MKKLMIMATAAIIMSACSHSKLVFYSEDKNYSITYPPTISKSTVARYVASDSNGKFTLIDSLNNANVKLDFWCYTYYRAMRGINMQYDSILPRLIKIRKREPENSAVYMTLGYTYSNLNDYNNAHEAISKGLQIAPENCDLLYELGKVYLAKGDTATALSYLRQSNVLAKKQNNTVRQDFAESMIESLTGENK